MRGSTIKLLLGTLAVALLLLGAALLLRRYVFGGEISAQRVGELLRSLHEKPLGALAVSGTYAVLASAFVPVTALIAGTALVFDAPHAFAYALCGSLLSAALSRGVGQIASKSVLRRMRGPRLAKLRDQLHTHTFSATVAARILPLGNFSAINLLAGALAVPWLPYMFGNLCGLVFGIAAFTLLTGRVAKMLSAPTPTNVAIGVAAVLAMIGVSIVLARVARRRERQQG